MNDKKKKSCGYYIGILLTVWSLGLGVTNIGQAQDFLPGINLYNRAQYDSLIAMVPGFIREHPEEEGLALYFLAESYYNQALKGNDPELVHSALEKAWSAFKLAGQDTEFKNSFKEYYFHAKYKTGWCSYRLARMQSTPAETFQRAYDEFLAFSASAPDSIKIFSYFMAAESKLGMLDAAFLSYLDTGELDQSISDFLAIQADVQELYDSIRAFDESRSTPQDFRSLLQLTTVKKRLLTSVFARFHGVLSLGLTGDESPRQLAEQKHVALAELKALRFENIPAAFADSQEDWDNTLAYLEMNRELLIYFLTHQQKNRDLFLQRWRKVGGADFHTERLFRRANLAHSHPDAESVEFNRLATVFYDSARAETESYYWLGYLQMIQGRVENSRSNLTAFSNVMNDGRLLSRRQQILVEDATYRKYLLDFERLYLANKYRDLRKLVSELADFQSGNVDVRMRKEQLNLLANSSVIRDPSRLWGEVLTGTDQQKLQLTLATVRFFLPRAALNIGETREKYIRLLNRLLRMTESRDQDHTRFFKGVVQSLEAEIQETAIGKSDKFLVAAQTMQNVRADYENKTEANYIQARCLFFADEFEAAKEILIPLINRKKSMRALFYLAEIFRLDDDGAAAKICYETIINKLRASDFYYDEFWLANAMAGDQSADDRGDLSALEGINIGAIEFQPGLHPDMLTYEILAEERFLKRQFARESVEWLMQFGLPQKDFPVSVNDLDASLLIPKNYFATTPYYFDEVRPPVTATLRLQVRLPAKVASPVQVKLGNDVLQLADDVYVKRFIPLNARLELSIDNADCYEFRESYLFDKPGWDEKAVVLSRKLDFVASGETTRLYDKFDYALAPRWDQNFVLNRIPEQDLDSELLRDFAGETELRDCAFDAQGNRILAVDAKEGRVWIYSNSASSRRQGELVLQGTTPLNSPEGIAVADGQIYVVDWGNHRVLHCDSSGVVLREIGSPGVNSPAEVGKQIKFIYPTRVAVFENSPAGGEHTEITQNYLYVADQNGIHICKMNGVYLDTLVPPGQTFKPGNFYGFFSETKNIPKLYLVDRLSKNKGQLVEYIATTW